jgi:hypothetical protein
MQPVQPVAKAAILAVAIVLVLAVAVVAPAGASYTSTVEADHPRRYEPLETTVQSVVGLPIYVEGSATVVDGVLAGSRAALVNGNLHQQAFARSIPSFTVEGWLKPPPVLSGPMRIFDSTGPWRFVVGLGQDRHLLVIDSLGRLLMGPAIGSSWHHLAVTRVAGGELRFYVDGILQGAPTPAGSGPLEPLAASIFAPPYHVWGGLGIALDELATYDYPLAEPRIAAHVSAAAAESANTAPTCPDRTFFLEQGTSLELVGNCSDADGDPLQYFVEEADLAALHGTFAQTAFNSALYTPNASFVGADRFHYWVSDGRADSQHQVATLVVRPAGSTGGSLSSSPNPPSAENPVVATVATSAPGQVGFDAFPTEPQAGYTLLGTTFDITAPPAPDAAHPLTLTFDVLDPGTGPVVPLRDGVPVLDCTVSPQPCVSSRSTSNGVQHIVVLTPHASRWSFASGLKVIGLPKGGTCAGNTLLTGAVRGDVKVPAGATCVVGAGVAISKDVKVARGGTLVVDHASIGHDLQSDHARGLVVGPAVSIGHDLDAKDMTAPLTVPHNQICGVTVGHDIKVENKERGAVPITLGCPGTGGGNSVGHDIATKGAVTLGGPNTAAHKVK